MSRGPGKVQRLILGDLSISDPTEINELCWRFGLKEGKVVRGELGKSFYAGFRRAVDQLVATGHVRRTEERLTNLEQLVKFYPFRTRSVPVKLLRERLLPILKNHLEETKALKFTAAEDEHYLLRQLPAETQKKARLAWEKLELRLIALLAHVRDERKYEILGLLARGRQLFIPPEGISHRRSLGSLITRVFDRSSLTGSEQAIQAEASAFYERFFPRVTVARNRFKSQLYCVVDLRRQSGTPKLTEDFEHILLERDRKFIEGLPGHRPGGELNVRAFLPRQEVKFSPMLDKLILRDALAPFDFLLLGR